MFSGPSVETALTVGMALVGASILAILSASYGNTSFVKAGFIILGLVVFYTAWLSGLFSTILHINVSTSFFLQLKGISISFASSFAYPIIFLGIFAANLSDRKEVSLYLAVFSLISLFWLFVFFRRVRLMEDTPSTRLHAAAQGYVELEGTVKLYDDEAVRGPTMDLPVMVWYRKYFLVSGAGFIFEDDKGRCTIDPRDAEVITPLENYAGVTYRAIYPGEKIYALGYLHTLSKQKTEYERKSLIRQMLVGWKRNKLRFLMNFDSNNDGVIDDEEMRFAHSAAERITDDDIEDTYQEPATHTISSPVDGRPFILSSIHPDDLVATYKRAMLFHFCTWSLLALFSYFI